MGTPNRRSLIVLAVAAVLLLAAGCGGDDEGSGGEGGPDLSSYDFENATGETEIEVEVKDNTFGPSFVEIEPGTTVTWENYGLNDHNITPIDADFEGVPTDQFGPGKVYSFTFDEEGDYAYYCTLHGSKSLNGQAGAIRVVSAE